MSRDVLGPLVREAAARILSGPLLVAQLREDPLILGWLAYEEEPQALIYGYTRKTFRRLGVFDSLFRSFHPEDSALPCRYASRCFPMLRYRYRLEFVPSR
jgi:hypothetical protein